jgi:hypothetical protein
MASTPSEKRLLSRMYTSVGHESRYRESISANPSRARSEPRTVSAVDFDPGSNVLEYSATEEGGIGSWKAAGMFIEILGGFGHYGNSTKDSSEASQATQA